MKSLAVPTSLQNCGVRLNRCRGVAAPLLRHATQNRAAHSNAPATARNGLCRPVTCAVKTGYMTTEVPPTHTAVWWQRTLQATLTRIAAAVFAAAALVLTPTACLAASTPAFSLPTLFTQLASRAQVLLGALVVAEPSNYALGMTGALIMMLITGMTLRRMDAPSLAAAGAPALPSPTRSITFASGAASFLGPAIAATPRPTIRDILKARPPRRRVAQPSSPADNVVPPPALRSDATPGTGPPPAVLASALAAANAPANVPSSRSLATDNTVHALKTARAARAAGLQRSVVPSAKRDDVTEDASTGKQQSAQEATNVTIPTTETTAAMTTAANTTQEQQQQQEHQEKQQTSGNIFTRMFHKQQDEDVGVGAVSEQQVSDVEAAATGLLSAMGLQPEPAGVRSRYDVWQAFLGITPPTVRSKYDPWTHIRAAAAPTGRAELDVFKVIVTIEAPQGRAAYDPLAGISSWTPPTGKPSFDPLAALLGATPPTGQPLLSLFRGLAEAEPAVGGNRASWDVVGALLDAQAPTATSKYDIMQVLRDAQAPTTVSKYDIGTELKNAQAPTGNAFNLIKDMVATISKASFNKQVDRDAPLQRVGLRDIDNVVGLGSSTKADGTKVDVYGVTMKKTT